MRDIFAPGTLVDILSGPKRALINGVALYAHGGILYEVVWWVDGERHGVWLSEDEFTTEEAGVQIGFKTLEG